MNTETKANPIEVIRMPGVTRVMLSGRALGIVADALEFAADASRTTADTLNAGGDTTMAVMALAEARQLDMVAQAIRASDAMDVDMPDMDTDVGRLIARDLHNAWGNA